MNKRIFTRSQGRVFSAIVAPVLLLAMVVLAGSAQGAGGGENADHSDGRMAIRSSEEGATPYRTIQSALPMGRRRCFRPAV